MKIKSLKIPYNYDRRFIKFKIEIYLLRNPNILKIKISILRSCNFSKIKMKILRTVISWKLNIKIIFKLFKH